MNPTLFAGLLILAAVYVLGWCLLRIASLRPEMPERGDRSEPTCPRCIWWRREYGVPEFPTCLKCGDENAGRCDHGVLLSVECSDCDPFANVVNLDSRRGKR